MKLKRTPLWKKHLALGAKIAEFASWEMPIHYEKGILAEHQHTRRAASLFDICHMGEFIIEGSNSRKILDKILARPVNDQKQNTCRYNFLLNDKGKVLDDLLIYCFDDETFLLVVNAGTVESDAETIISRLPDEISFINISESTAKLDLQGPAASEVLKRCGLKDHELPEYYHFKETVIAGIEVLISRTGYTGELGFELYCNVNAVDRLWEFLLSDKDVEAAGLGCRDTLRLEVGFALYGHELDDKTTPVEAGYSKILGLDSTFNRDATGLLALKNDKPKKF